MYLHTSWLECVTWNHKFNLLVPRQHGRHFVKFMRVLSAILHHSIRPLDDFTAMLWRSLCVHSDIAMLWRPVSPTTQLHLVWACCSIDLSDLVNLTAICNAATALYGTSQRPSGDQQRCGRFFESQRGGHPVWLGYYTPYNLPARSPHAMPFTYMNYF